MNEELTLAIDELRERPSSRRWFIPVLINETAIPPWPISRTEDLSDIQALSLYENWSDGIERILRVLKYDDPVSARVYSLIDDLRRPFYHDRLSALQRLGSIGPAAADAVQAVTEALKDQNAHVRAAAVYALSRIGPAAVPELAKALKDQNAHVRSSAGDALRWIGPAAADAVPELTEALKDQNPDVRWSAAYALRWIGPAAADAVPELAKALKDQNPDVRWSAADALESLRQKS